jgi:type IV pilus assembly protein PilP
MNIFILFLICISAVGAQTAPKKPLKNFFGDKTKIDNPFNLRDPFKAPTIKTDASKKRRGFYLSGKGQYSNISETPLEELSVDEIKVIGVLIGKERRALVNLGGTDSKRVTILKEGMKIGPEAAELKAILPGGIVLVEKIVNVYGEEEYLETVIPISR